MTREEIINEIKCLLAELNNGEYVVSYLTQNDVKWLNENIKALEQEPTNSVLKNIKAEISDELVRMYMYRNYANGLGKAIELIDKYMTEIEPQESKDKE